MLRFRKTAHKSAVWRLGGLVGKLLDPVRQVSDAWAAKGAEAAAPRSTPKEPVLPLPPLPKAADLAAEIYTVDLPTSPQKAAAHGIRRRDADVIQWLNAIGDVLTWEGAAAGLIKLDELRVRLGGTSGGAS